MSTLTKILIVLLTLSSIFLCGIVVTYVANADDYKRQARDLRRQRDTAQEKEKSANDQRRKLADSSERIQNNLNKEIASLRTKIGELDGKLKNMERERAGLLQKVTNMASVVETANQTAKDQTDLFKGAQAELEQLKAEQIKDRQELDDTIVTLNEKMAVIATLEAEKRQLQEQVAALQTRLDEFFLRDFGKEPIPPTTVTQRPGEKAQPAPPVAKKTELNALLTDVNLKHSMAEISIGAAQGVKDGMRFFVTRGAEFICELLIVDVDTDKALGIMERVQTQPKVGDNASTNL